jgi:uncharacterized membrane protein (UPF0127 family)
VNAVRWLALSVIVACSTNHKRDDAAAMTPPEPIKPATPGPTVYITTPQGELAVEVEVVQTPPKIERGLMWREHLAPDAGMLFFMGAEDDWAFYMRNTLIPLDMIFITKDLTIAGIVERAEPKTETLRRVGKPSLYVLEVNGGWTQKRQVSAGAKVRFERMPPPP